jgi:hypothetical protein
MTTSADTEVANEKQQLNISLDLESLVPGHTYWPFGTEILSGFTGLCSSASVNADDTYELENLNVGEF